MIMNKGETAELLTLMAAFDQRTLGQTDVEAWYLALRDIPLDASTKDAVVAFYADAGAAERRWMQPHDLIRARKKIRADRLEKITPRPAPNEVEGVRSWAEERAIIRAIGDGVIRDQRDCGAYTAWGGSLHQAYQVDALPALDRITPVVLAWRDVKALTAGAFHGPEEARRAVSDGPVARPGLPVPTLPVPCPWRPCRAPAGEPCIDGAGNPIAPHGARRAVAQPPE